MVAESKASGNCIRNTVAALMASGSTISESSISLDVKKQRQHEMDVLLNRFHKDGNENSNPSAPQLTPPRPTEAPPPPPPPMPQQSDKQQVKKRRSGDDEEKISPEVRSTLDDIKRVRVNPPKDGRLYPGLSDIETTESDQDNYTTATVSVSEGEEEEDDEDYDGDNRRMMRRDDDNRDEEDDRWDKFLDFILFLCCVG